MNSGSEERIDSVPWQYKISEKMESANRGEAERCLRFAKSTKDVGKARRFAEKSYRLCPTPECREFLDQLASSPHTHSEDSDTQEKEEIEEEVGRSAKDEKEYTANEEEAVKRILRCQDYYDILGVSRDVDETGLKRQYRKLALQFHPDKNRAPKADEAFKAISKAYAVLSDPEKRSRYDQFGEDGLNLRTTQTTRGYDPDFDADELFRAFFGDSFGFGGNHTFVYRSRGPGFQYTFRPQYRAHHHHHHHHNHNASGTWLHVCQMLPIIVLLLASLFSSVLFAPFYPSQPFSLERTSVYTMERFTEQHKLRYFVQESFTKDYPTRQLVAAVEKDVKDEYIWQLRAQCRADQLSQSFNRRKGTGKDLPKSCKKLKELWKSR